MSYDQFLNNKSQLSNNNGFAPLWMPSFLFGFQEKLVEWSLLKGRAAIFADCGLGKTPMQLVWAENIVRKTNKPVLILTPLAVAHQTLKEAQKFDIECHRNNDGNVKYKINVTNYEKLHYFNSDDFIGIVCDESSILKSFNGARRKAITEFMRRLPYRLLCTATAAPNDYIELGTSSEALGYLGYTDMLNRFFKNEHNNSATGRMYGEPIKWRLKHHAEKPFWRWVCSWARATRKPSDLGFDDADFILPPLVEKEHLVKAARLADGALFELPAKGLAEQREERRRTIRERCEKVASLVNDKTTGQALVWCALNAEGDLLESLIPDSKQISGKDSDEKKEERFIAFAEGNLRVLVSKPKIGAWGLNFQRCSHITYFPSHSYEQYYQGVRRCWRFGQKNPVTVDIVTTNGGHQVMCNMKRKAALADKMFSHLVEFMNEEMAFNRIDNFNQAEVVPEWL